MLDDSEVLELQTDFCGQLIVSAPEVHFLPNDDQKMLGTNVFKIKFCHSQNLTNIDDLDMYL